MIVEKFNAKIAHFFHFPTFNDCFFNYKLMTKKKKNNHKFQKVQKFRFFLPKIHIFGFNDCFCLASSNLLLFTYHEMSILL